MSATTTASPPPTPVAAPRASAADWLRMLGVVVGLELRQRVRSVAWYVLLGIVALVVGGVIVVLWLSLQGYQRDIGGAKLDIEPQRLAFRNRSWNPYHGGAEGCEKSRRRDRPCRPDSARPW